MCEFTVPGTGRGAGKHYYRKEPVCDECKAAAHDYDRHNRQRTPGSERRHQVWKYYRLRWHEFETLFARQGGVCAMCGGSVKKKPSIDHDPACDHPGRGKRSCAACVRGVLCQRCNLGIAILDDSEWLQRAVRYLGEEHPAIEILRESRLF